MRIVYTGGGTGGHIFPLLAIHRALEKLFSETRGKNIRAYYIGADGFAKHLIKNSGISLKIIHAGKWRRYASFEQIFDIVKFFLGFFEVFWRLFWTMPDIVFSKGGYGSFWVVVIAWFFRIPIVIHESDSHPGFTNRIVSVFASRIIVSFEYTTRYFREKKTLCLGNPTRDELFLFPSENPQQILSLRGGRPLIVVMGGSQGAQRLNEIIVEILPELVSTYEILHQCGERNYDEIQKESAAVLGVGENPYYHLYGFLDERMLRNVYRSADIIISRAGSGSVFEIARSGKPSILIPLEGSASDHQKSNAFLYAESGAGVVLEEPNLTPHLFTREIHAVLENSQQKKEMSGKAREFAKPDAAKDIAREIVTIIS